VSRRSLVICIAALLVSSLSCALPVNAQPPKEITNSIGMKLVLIHKDASKMDSSPGERVSLDDGDYYLGVHEVTQAQYAKVMKVNPSRFQWGRMIDPTPKKRPGGNDGMNSNRQVEQKRRTTQPTTSSNHPVECVSWYEAMEFCKRLSALPKEEAAGRTYRLPTEEEWEYACGAGSKTAFCFGDSDNSLDEYAWFKGNSGGQTHPVGQKKPNAWGLFDMHGNVCEWISLEYLVSDYTVHGLRGGFYLGNAGYCKTNTKGNNGFPERTPMSGFRIALSPSEVTSPGEQGQYK
jgi:formylglycine-generating enzyme required for sulfatase activity